MAAGSVLPASDETDAARILEYAFAVARQCAQIIRRKACKHCIDRGCSLGQAIPQQVVPVDPSSSTWPLSIEPRQGAAGHISSAARS